MKYDLMLDQNILQITFKVWKLQVKQHNWFLLT